MDLEKLTKKELLDLAAKKKIKGRTTLSKDELVKVLMPFYKSGSKATTADKNNTEHLSSNIDDNKKAAPKNMPKPDEYPIPNFYDKDTLVLLPVDPSKEYVYWEISSHTFSVAQKKYGLDNAPIVLKLFKSDNHTQQELASVPISMFGNWFFHIYAPESVLWSEIGVIDKNGVFHSILKSAAIRMPADKVSPIIDEETWMTIGKNLEELYALSGVNKHELGASRSLHQAIVQQITNSVSSTGFVKEK